ncbi:hypothetical protein pipiens_015285 [Culex pipiens pipiens]|uniref:Uncharacterized protein n=1 Tax=Culex pipiens pipiens TaxID=38569 RepID=A0ABD1CR63_CULPP
MLRHRGWVQQVLELQQRREETSLEKSLLVGWMLDFFLHACIVFRFLRKSTLIQQLLASGCPPEVGNP